MACWSTKKFIALLLVVISIVLLAVAVISNKWVDDENYTNTVDIGLTKWEMDGTTRDLSDDDTFPAGSDAASDYAKAGLAALMLAGAVLLCAIASALIIFIYMISNPKPRSGYAKWAIALCWMAGLFSIVGAVMYEVLRPSFDGDVGYNWAFGVFIGSGIGLNLSTIVMFWADRDSGGAKLPAPANTDDAPVIPPNRRLGFNDI